MRVNPQQTDRGCWVGGDEVPLGVDDDGGEVVFGDHELDELVEVVGVGLVEWGVAVVGCIAGGEQDGIAVAQRHIEVLAQVQDHFGARLGAARFDVAEVFGGHVGAGGEIELTVSSLTAPVAQH